MKKGAAKLKEPLKSILYNKTRISVVHGDLTDEAVGAIVNAANEDLWLGAGVAGAVRKKGGSQIQHECNEYVKKNGIVETGGACYTGPGLMRCQYTIHAVGPIWKDGNSNERKHLHSCVKKSLDIGKDLKLKNISFPAISSGIFGFPKPECARILFETSMIFIDENPDVYEEIRFTNFDKPTVDVFMEEINKREKKLKKEQDKLKGSKITEELKSSENSKKEEVEEVKTNNNEIEQGIKGLVTEMVDKACEELKKVSHRVEKDTSKMQDEDVTSFKKKEDSKETTEAEEVIKMDTK